MVRIGIIGAGYWGSKHIRNFSELADAELVMVCDRSFERLQAVKYLYTKTAVTTSYDELLASNVEAVVIATPPDTHCEMAERALLAGKHTLVERPMTRNIAEAERLTELAAKRDLRLMVSHPYEYNAAVSFLRDYMARGEMGDLLYVQSAHLNLGLFPSGADVPWDQAADDISIFTDVLGGEPECVSARRMRQTSVGRLQAVQLEMLFANNVLAHAYVTGFDPGKVRRVTFVGSKKTVVFDDITRPDPVWIYDRAVGQQVGGGFDPGSVVDSCGEAYPPDIVMQDPLRVACQDFLECVQEGRSPLSGVASAMRVVRVLEEAEASGRSGGVRQPIARREKPFPALVELQALESR